MTYLAAEALPANMPAVLVPMRRPSTLALMIRRQSNQVQTMLRGPTIRPLTAPTIQPPMRARKEPTILPLMVVPMRQVPTIQLLVMLRAPMPPMNLLLLVSFRHILRHTHLPH